jgi:hypothetical protein
MLCTNLLLQNSSARLPTATWSAASISFRGALAALTKGYEIPSEPFELRDPSPSGIHQTLERFCQSEIHANVLLRTVAHMNVLAGFQLDLNCLRKEMRR